MGPSSLLTDHMRRLQCPPPYSSLLCNWQHQIGSTMSKVVVVVVAASLFAAELRHGAGAIHTCKYRRPLAVSRLCNVLFVPSLTKNKFPLFVRHTLPLLGADRVGPVSRPPHSQKRKFCLLFFFSLVLPNTRISFNIFLV